MQVTMRKKNNDDDNSNDDGLSIVITTEYVAFHYNIFYLMDAHKFVDSTGYDARVATCYVVEGWLMAKKK